MSKRRKARPRSLYARMHTAIIRGSKRYLWFIPAGLIGLIAGGLSWWFNLHYATRLEAAGLALMHAVLGTAIVLLAILVLDSLGLTERESKLVAIGLTFLERGQYANYIIETIDSRAEIGSAAGQIRTLFPILTLPIVISLVGLQLNILTIDGTLGIMILVILVIAFFKELDRANIDVVIRHVIAEYRCNQRRQRIMEQEADRFLEQLVILTE